jgi:dipeptide/tripeptide permease
VLGSTLATGSVALLVGPPSTAVFLASMAVFGLGASLLASAPAALVADVSPARGGRVVAVFQMASDLGGILGPLAAGALTDAVDYQLAFGVTAAVLFAGLAAALALPRR